MDPEKLKVVDLRKELQQRGLETKGNKAVLVKRLRDALDHESGKGPSKPLEQDPLDNENDEDHEEEAEPEEEPVKVEPKTPKKAAPVKKEVPATPKRVVKEQAKPAEKVVKVEPSPVKTEPAEEAAAAREANGEKVKETPAEVKMEAETRGEKRKRDEDDEDEDEEVESKEKKRREDSPVKSPTKSPTKTPSKSAKSPAKTPVQKEKVVPKEDEPEIDNTKSQLSWYDSDLHLKIDNKNFLSAKPLNEGCFGYIWSGARANHGISSGKACFEVKITEELKWEDPSEKMQEKTDKVLKDRYKIDRRKDKGPKSDDKKKSESDKDDEKKTDEKSSEGENEKNEKSEENGEKSEEKMETEEANSEEKEKVEADKEKEKVEGEKENEKVEGEEEKEAKSEEEAKAEEKKDGEATENMETEEGKEKPEEKPQLPPIPTHYFRVGFSLLKTSLQLGESKHSYAYESTGKFITDKEFKEYGVTFGVGDVIGAYLNIDDDNVSITFTVNGAPQPTAITVPRSEFPEENFALFPHVLCRNYAYELNFGQKEEPWFPHPEELKDYPFLQAVEGKIEGPKRLEKREDCEVLLMVGLPGSGKTQWVKNHIASQTDKHYTVIGNHPLFDRMTVEGEPMKSRFRGSWKILVDRMQKCLNQLTDLAALRRRNFIIDQTNVFPNAQRRKLRAFDGFKRKAVIVICEDDEHARRQKDQQNDYGKTVPESTMYDLKAQMELPQKCEWIDELVFTDLNEEESKKKVKAYNEEATKKGYFKRYQQGSNAKRNQQKNFRGNRRGGAPYNSGRFDRYNSSQGFNRPSSWGNRRDSRPPPARQGGGSAWRQPNRGAVRSFDQNRSRDNRSGYGGNRNQTRNPAPWANSGGGSSWGSGNNQGGGWNAAMYGSHGYGVWNQQNQGQSAWKFGGNNQSGGYGTGQGQRGYGGNQGGYGNNQGYNQGYNSQGSYGNQGYNSGSQGYGGQGGFGQQNWNYYGQYSQQQGWGNQQRRK